MRNNITVSNAYSDGALEGHGISIMRCRVFIYIVAALNNDRGWESRLLVHFLIGWGLFYGEFW